MGVSYEGAGWFFKYIVCPVGIFGFIGNIIGGNIGMAFVCLIGAIIGFFGPKIFGE